jgi:hypothetical protein
MLAELERLRRERHEVAARLETLVAKLAGLAS